MKAAIKNAAKQAAQLAESSGMLSLLDRTSRSRPETVRIMMYHRIADPESTPALYPGLVSATPPEFERQMEYLRSHHTVISLEELLAAKRGEQLLPPRAVLLTFDDAYTDFFDNAWPVLQKLELPAVLFVPTAYPARAHAGFWWDRVYEAVLAADDPQELVAIGELPEPRPTSRLQIYKGLRDRIKSLPHSEAMKLVDRLCSDLGEPVEHSVLDWDRLRALAKAGVALGAHTRTHPLLNRVSKNEIRAEARGCQDDLQREIGTAPPVLAYPAGGVDDDAVEVLSELGFELAFTTKVGVADLARQHPLRLPRIAVTENMTLPILRAQLLPQFDLLTRTLGR